MGRPEDAGGTQRIHSREARLEKTVEWGSHRERLWTFCVSPRALLGWPGMRWSLMRTPLLASQQLEGPQQHRTRGPGLFHPPQLFLYGILYRKKKLFSHILLQPQKPASTSGNVGLRIKPSTSELDM